MKPSPHALLVFPLLLAACSREAPQVAWTPLEPGRLDPEQGQQLALAETARGELFGELVAALSVELERSGPAGAIGVCREQAPRIAAATSEKLGVQIGRTSFRLRNPENRAPAWARPALEARPQEPVLLAGPGGELGATFPIRLAAKCLACHGSEQEIAPDVRERIAQLYPEDQATGFAEGDLRGWFWVEVPAADG